MLPAQKFKFKINDVARCLFFRAEPLSEYLPLLFVQVVGGAPEARVPPAADAAAGGARRDALLRLPGAAGAVRQVPPLQDAADRQLPGVPGAHGGHRPRAAASPAQGGGAEAEESGHQGRAGVAREIRGGLQAAFPGIPLPEAEQEGTLHFYCVQSEATNKRKKKCRKRHCLWETSCRAWFLENKPQVFCSSCSSVGFGNPSLVLAAGLCLFRGAGVAPQLAFTLWLLTAAPRFSSFGESNNGLKLRINSCWIFLC